MRKIMRLTLMLLCSTLSLQAVADKKESFNDFIKDKTYQKGYFSFYHDKDNGKVFLELTQFEKQFIFQSSLPKGIGSNDIGLDRGQLGNTRLVQFENAGDKVFLRELNSYYRANTSNQLEKEAVEEAFASSIIWGFKVAKRSKDNKKILIDYTPFLLSDIHNLSASLKQRKQGNFKIDASRSALYEKRSKSFPHNTELEATVTFTGSGAGQYLKSVTPDASAVTVNLHHSLIKLPDNNYKPRAFHPFSGFWSAEYADYASAIDEPLIKRNIPRHRLIKKDPTAMLSESVEPIVYYLDAGVPEPVRSALLEGASWWNQAFTAIGYKDAFQVKLLPSDADPMDVRYNVIQWVHRATRGWSYGASVIDPRTGEIIKGHVTLGSLRVRQDYLIALGLTSPFKSENTDTSAMKAMALARIRQLSAHEVGHTLGIAHNFAASVNNRASVMDYPHPYITLKNDEIDLSNAYAENIGVWDKYVIAYGYSDVAQKEEGSYLANLIKEAKAKGLEYVSDADARAKSSAHSTGHLWDNGENASDELLRVLKVREVALTNFGLNSIPNGTPFAEIEAVLAPIYNFHRFQVEAAAKLISGVQYSYSVKGEATQNSDNNKVFNIVSGKEQNAAFQALLTTLTTKTLTLPDHITALIPPKAYGYYRDRESFTSNTGITFDPVSAAQGSAKHTIALILNAQRLARLAQQHVMNKDILSVGDVFNQLINATVKQEAQTGMSLLVQQRVNQEVIEHLLTLWHNKSLVTEVRAEVYMALLNLEEWLDDNNDARKYKGLWAQFNLFERQIEHSLKQGELISPNSSIAMPPGSPIGSENQLTH
jgi:hypothetical protein